MNGILYLVPNLLGVVAPPEVLPLRTIETARRLDHWVVETPKAARAFIKSLSPPHAIAALDIRELGQAPSPAHLKSLLAPAFAGQDIGLLSDAGCPGVADPGAALVAAAHAAGIRLAPLVGPSALLLALMASGMNGQTFAFHGYLPIKTEARAQRLRALDDIATQSGATQLFIETPYRTAAMIAAVLTYCRRETQFCIAADLTLESEWVARRTIAAWRKESVPPLDKRPAVFLLGA
ncbi:MAG: SAM-dependent methyltransferase [Casimicrobiaceae bacterium]